MPAGAFSNCESKRASSPRRSRTCGTRVGSGRSVYALGASRLRRSPASIPEIAAADHAHRDPHSCVDIVSTTAMPETGLPPASSPRHGQVPACWMGDLTGERNPCPLLTGWGLANVAASRQETPDRQEGLGHHRPWSNRGYQPRRPSVRSWGQEAEAFIVVSNMVVVHRSSDGAFVASEQSASAFIA